MNQHISKALAISAFSALILSSNVLAQDMTLGSWVTIDEKSNLPSSRILIEERNGELIGTVTELITTPGEMLQTHCTLCKGDLKGKPIIGMTILKGLKKDKPGQWSGGEIVDPDDGEVYKVRLSTDDGKILKVRGYIGIPLLGRTQNWIR